MLPNVSHDDSPSDTEDWNASSDNLVPDDHRSNDHEGDFVTSNERKDLARGLEQRHIGLIALAGAIVCPITISKPNGAY